MFLSGLSGLVNIDGVNEVWPMSSDSAFELTVTPNPMISEYRVNELASAVNDSDLLNGALGVIQDGNRLIFSGRVAAEWLRSGSMRDELLRWVAMYVPYVGYDFRAEVNRPISTTDTNTDTGGSSGVPTNPLPNLPDKLFGIDSKYVVIGVLALLIYVSQGK